MVAVHDTIMETTTITIRENEAGDTIRMSRIIERDRIRDRAQVRNTDVEVKLVRDTVYVERKDSVKVEETLRQAQGDSSRGSPVVSSLKWIFAIIVAVIALIIVIKVSKVFKFF